MNWTLNVADGAAVEIGQFVDWQPELEEAHATGGIVELHIKPALTIPDFDFDGIVSALQVAQNGRIRYLEVELDIKHTYIGDLQIDLVAPSGRAVRLHDRAGGRQQDLQRTYSLRSCPQLADMYAHSIDGQWCLRVRDTAQVDEGQLRAWGLKIWH